MFIYRILMAALSLEAVTRIENRKTNKRSFVLAHQNKLNNFLMIYDVMTVFLTRFAPKNNKLFHMSAYRNYQARKSILEIFEERQLYYLTKPFGN